MDSNYEIRKQHVTGEAVRAGKFSEARRPFWEAQYDANPEQTERTLAALAPATEGTEPYPPSLFPHLSQRRHPQMRSASVATTATSPPAPAEIEDEDVARWSRQLFPEVARAAAGAGRRRVVKCND